MCILFYYLSTGIVNPNISLDTLQILYLHKYFYLSGIKTNNRNYNWRHLIHSRTQEFNLLLFINVYLLQSVFFVILLIPASVGHHQFSYPKVTCSCLQVLLAIFSFISKYPQTFQIILDDKQIKLYKKINEILGQNQKQDQTSLHSS